MYSESEFVMKYEMKEQVQLSVVRWRCEQPKLLRSFFIPFWSNVLQTCYWNGKKHKKVSRKYTKLRQPCGLRLSEKLLEERNRFFTQEMCLNSCLHLTKKNFDKIKRSRVVFFRKE